MSTSCDHSPMCELHERPHVMHVNDGREVSAGTFGSALRHAFLLKGPDPLLFEADHVIVACSMPE